MLTNHADGWRKDEFHSSGCLLHWLATGRASGLKVSASIIPLFLSLLFLHRRPRSCLRRRWWMHGERESQCWSNASQHILIYLQTFTSYSEILVRNCNFFPPPCIGGVPIGILGKSLDLRKLESWGYQAVKSEDSLMTGWAVSTQYQRMMDGQTDGQTDSL